MPKATPGSTKAQEIAERQVTVAKLRRSGWTQEAIAEHLGVSLTTINRDCQGLVLELHKTAVGDMDGWRAAKLEEYQTARDSLTASLAQVENVKDRAPLVQALMRVDERESKLLGLDAPERAVVTASVMSDAEADEILARYGDTP